MTNRSIECVKAIYHEKWKFKNHKTRDGEVNGFYPWTAWQNHCMDKESDGQVPADLSYYDRYCPKQKGEL